MAFWDWLVRGRRSARMTEGMARMLAGTAETEIGCDEVYELLDQYAELVANGKDTESLLPLVHHHLSMCRDCREELEALLKAIRGAGN